NKSWSGSITPVGPVGPGGPGGPVGPVGPGGPGGPVGPVGPIIPFPAICATCLNLLSNNNSFLIAIDKVSLTLEFTANISSSVAGGDRPGIVPSAYCIFSPSAFTIWARLSSSIATEANRRFITSFLLKEILGVIFGILGYDIPLLPSLKIFLNMLLYIPALN